MQRKRDRPALDHLREQELDDLARRGANRFGDRFRLGHRLAVDAALEHAGLWEAVAPKLVLGENIVQTAQFVETGNADAGSRVTSMGRKSVIRSGTQAHENRNSNNAVKPWNAKNAIESP